MKARAETVTPGKRVAGLTGAQWVRAIHAQPGRTLPPGAGALIVAHFEQCADILREAAQADRPIVSDDLIRLWVILLAQD